MKLAKDITFDDIAQWLDTGFFFYRNDAGRSILGRAVQFPRPNAPELIITDIADDNKTIEVKSWDRITLHWPMCGYVNMPDFNVAFDVTRLQMRQWCRTYNPHCVRVSIPCHYLVSRAVDEEAWAKMRSMARSSSACLVRALFNPVYYSYGEAVALLERKPDTWHTVAINASTLISRAGHSLYDLYYRGEFAGSIEDRVFSPTNQTITRKVMKLFDGAVTL